MQHGSLQLRDWQKRQGINEREASRRLGVHYTTYNQFVRRRRLPGRQLAIAIHDLTGIPVHAWTPLAVSKSKKATPKKDAIAQDLQAANGQII